MNASEAVELLSEAWARNCDNEERLGFEGLSRPEQVFSLIWMLKAEIDNGGFAQYMFNPTGDHAVLAPSALREIGAAAAADVCERFYAMLPGGQPARTQDERQAQLDSFAASGREYQFQDDCELLEQRFYALEGDIHIRLVSYLTAHSLLYARDS